MSIPRAKQREEAYAPISGNELDMGLMMARQSYQEASTKMLCTFIVAFFFMALEFIGGYISNSLAIMTDVAHLFSDNFGFLVSLIGICKTKGSHYSFMTFGYHRSEAIGNFISVTIIYGFAIWLTVEGVRKLYNPTPINSTIMLITAVLSLFCNILVVKLTHGHYIPSSAMSNIHKYSLRTTRSYLKKKIDYEDNEEKESSLMRNRMFRALI